VRKIGVWNTAFMGDALLTLPLLHSIKATHPGAELHFFVRKGFEPLFTDIADITAVHAYDKRGAQKGLRAAFDFGRSLGRQGFDCWVSAHRSLRSGLIAKVSNIAMRIGYDEPKLNSLFYTHTVQRSFDELEEIERLLRLAEPLGITKLIHEPHFVPPAAGKAFADELFSGMGGPVLGLHPGSTWPSKRWPAQHFGRVLALAVEAGVQVCVFAGPGEEEAARKTLEAAGAAAGSSLLRDLSGKPNLAELAAVIGRLSCYLTNDSGPMHLSWMQKTPTVALFGPTVRRLGFFPRGEHSLVLEENIDCRPCGLHGHKKCPKSHHRCMREISPETAWQAVESCLGKEPS
jgi:heptosyltransferase-2